MKFKFVKYSAAMRKKLELNKVPENMYPEASTVSLYDYSDEDDAVNINLDDPEEL
jgi:hypothetical protein